MCTFVLQKSQFVLSTTNDAYAALRIPAFRRFLTMRLFTTLAVQIMSVSVGYFVYDLTNSKLMLGYIGLTEALPAIGVTLFAGHLADKRNRRNILVGCVSLLLLCGAALWVLSWQRDQLPHNLLLLGVFTVIAMNGVARGFFSPTHTAFFPQLIDKQTLPNAITWNSSTWEVASISGLGIGGLLYGFAGVEWAFGTMTMLLAIALVVLSTIKPRPIPQGNHSEPMWLRIREGLKFVFSRQLIIASIAMDLFAVLFGGAVALLPVFARDILHVGPQGMGALRAAMSLGAISTAFFIAHRPLGKNAGKLLLAAVAGFGLCMIGFGLSTWFWVSFACLFFAGVFDEVSVFIRASLQQHLTPDHMRGRVSSVVTVFITSSNEIGAFESGLAASLMGTVPSVVFGGLMTLGVVGATWWAAPQLRTLDFQQFNTSEENTA